SDEQSVSNIRPLKSYRRRCWADTRCAIRAGEARLRDLLLCATAALWDADPVSKTYAGGVRLSMEKWKRAQRMRKSDRVRTQLPATPHRQDLLPTPASVQR